MTLAADTELSLLRERDAAKESAEFYLDLFCTTKETQHGG